MTANVDRIIRRHCQPLAPLPTSESPRCEALPRIQAVLFDIYGTMLVSGAGDITLQTGDSSDDAFRQALLECGVSPDAASQVDAGLLKQMIAEHHARGRSQGVDFPEVDIVEVWRDTLKRIAGATVAEVDPERVAVEYEVRVNPVWPMPGLLACLAEIRRRGLLLGIVSNAQAMTIAHFPPLLNATLEDLGFSDDLQFFSYRYGESKPGLSMFRAAATALEKRGVPVEAAAYIGNDMLNDVWAAAQVGFKTILFAGDARSLRLRADVDQVRDCSPNATVTDLRSITDCLAQ